MSMLLPELVTLLAPVLDLVRLTDEVPEPEDVKAGWTAFGLFLGGVAAVALLGWSLVKQLRKVEEARKQGVYGDEPEVDGETRATPADEGSPQA